MRSAARLLIIGVAVMLMPGFVQAQCPGKCEGACLQAAADAFARSVPDNKMFLMSVEDLARMVDEGNTELVILDVRPAQVYAKGHIKGSMSVPLPMVVEQMGGIPTQKKIAVVCSMDTNSAFAVAILRMHGRDAWIVDGGVIAWEGLGRELTK